MKRSYGSEVDLRAAEEGGLGWRLEADELERFPGSHDGCGTAPRHARRAPRVRERPCPMFRSLDCGAGVGGACAARVRPQRPGSPAGGIVLHARGSLRVGRPSAPRPSVGAAVAALGSATGRGPALGRAAGRAVRRPRPPRA